MWQHAELLLLLAADVSSALPRLPVLLQRTCTVRKLWARTRMHMKWGERLIEMACASACPV